MQQDTIIEHSAVFSLYHAIKANDEAALNSFYTDNYYKAEKYILNNNGTIEHAKDIYQEAFIAVWRNIQLDKFYPENENSLTTYLQRIAKNKWVDYLRSNHYKNTDSLTDDAGSNEEDLSSENVQYISEVEKKFKLLGEKCRKLLTGFYYQKESLRDIAHKFEWTEATAKNNKYRCLKRLRELLNN